MRTRNTYVALLLALAAGTALTIVSCTRDTTAPIQVAAAPDPQITNAKVEDLRQKYGWVGKYHTDGLAYVYTQLSKSDGKLRTRAGMCRLATKALKEFHQSARRGEVPTALMGPSFQNEACISDSEVAPIRQTVLALPPGNQRRLDLSRAATNYMDRIGAVPYNSTSESDFISQVNAIEYQAAASLPESEAGAVSAVASVARSSVQYWKQNLGAWSTMPGALPLAYSREVGGAPGQPVAGYWPDWFSNPVASGFGKVLGADILAGARTFYLAWELGPVSWEAVAASALFASITTAIALLF